jgi:hypothetical protein
MRAIMMQRFDKLMQAVDVFLCDDWFENREPNDEWDFYDNMTGHPKIVFPKKFQEKDGFLLPRSEMMVGRLYDESTLLTVAHVCHQAAGLTQRPPLDQFLAQKDEILTGEEYPDENRYYPD